MTSENAKKRLALSFRKMSEDRENNLVVVPPLLRQEVTAIRPEAG